MPDRSRLQRLLDQLDGRQYPAYRDLLGAWRLGPVELIVDRVQGDPFAAPSRVRVRHATGLAGALLTDPDRRVAAEDWLLRRFLRHLHGSKRGSGRSGALEVYEPGPEVIERSALRLLPDGRAEVRFCVGLPAGGRRILGRQAAELLLDDVPRAASSLAAGPGLEEHVRCVVRQRSLRRALRAAGLVAFVEDGSILPRASGVSQAPLEGAVPFFSPPSLRVELPCFEGTAVGLGLRRGVTVITGGGFHGKSTLLQALERGHLDHVPGDGRHGVVSDPDTVKVRAEDGRSVCKVDISSLLGELPGGRSTTAFSTADASGSTSQAAALIEAVESGARVLLIDEDTSATNLLVRDERMRALIPRALEPITPLVERVRQMAETWGTSTVLVVGGVGDYLPVADTVLSMQAWQPHDLTAAARALGMERPVAPGPLGPVRPRVVLPPGLGAAKVRARTARAVQLGEEEVDLVGVGAVLDEAHAATLGHAIRWLEAEGLIDGQRDLAAIWAAFDAILDDDGVDVLSPWEAPGGFLSRPRRHEVAAALSRLRSLRVR